MCPQVCGARPPRVIIEPGQLSKPSQDLLRIFAKNATDRFTVVDAKAHEWLVDESVHGAKHWVEGAAAAQPPESTARPETTPRTPGARHV